MMPAEAMTASKLAVKLGFPLPEQEAGPLPLLFQFGNEVAGHLAEGPSGLAVTARRCTTLVLTSTTNST